MLLNYLKIAWKVLLRHPFYTFITLFGISLTLTVIMLITSFADHVLGSHYPEQKRERMLFIQMMAFSDTARQSFMSSPMAFNFATKYVKSLKTPENVSISSFLGSSNAYVGNAKVELKTKFTDAAFWEIMQFDFLEGKPFNDSNILNGEHVAVITDKFKKEYFDNTNDPVVGEDIEIESIHYKVIGVVKGSPVTRLYSNADVYFPYTAPKSNYQNGDWGGGYVAVVLAKDRADIPAVQSEFTHRVNMIPKPIVMGQQKFDKLEISILPYVETWLSMILRKGEMRTMLYSVIVAVVFMLLGLPAINLVNINVSRILERSSEIGVRKAFGAPISKLLWQFIVENIFITFIGGAIAMLFTLILIHMINASGWIAYADLEINFTIFLVSIVVVLIFGFVSGVLPALRMSKLNIVDALKN